MAHPLRQWAARLFTVTRPRRQGPTFRPTLERLEDRLTPSATFAGQVTFAVGVEPNSVAVGDFNGDGKMDLVTANFNNSEAGTVSVLLNNTAVGATAPSYAGQVTFAVGAGANSVAVGDFNGDGRPDLAVTNFDDGTVSVLLNTTATGATAPSFAAAVTFAVGGGPLSVAVGDVNGDGKPDLAVTNFNGVSSSVSVLLNTTATGATTPSFAPQLFLGVGHGPESVAVGDVNGDGRPDLAVANYNDNTVSVLLDTTTTGATVASFAAQQTFAVGVNPVFVALGDVNGDGRPDLIAANFNNGGAGTVSVLLDTTPSGATAASFASQVTFTVGAGPESVAVGDFNGDGKPDLAVANSGGTTVSILSNTMAAGAAAPSFAAQQTFAVGNSPTSVAAVDVNGDGRPDLAVANFGGNTVSMLLDATAPQTLVPTFAGQTTFATGVEPISVASADFNGDGKPDLAVANFHIGGAGTLSVLLNNTPAGTTVPAFGGQFTFAVGSEPISVAVGDFNGDGRPDIAVANLGDDTVSVLLNNTAAGATAPSFATAITFAVGSEPYSLAVADFNGDGRPDLAVANFLGDTVSILLNTTAAGATTPSFAAQQTFAVGADPISVAVGDFNDDGKPDLAVANLDDGTVSVLLNKTAAGATAPSFAAQTTFAVGASPHWVAVGDFNGDGKPDIAVANDRSSGTVSVLLDTAAAGAAAPSFAAPVTFAVGSQPESLAVGDFNGDGTTDLAVANSGDNTVSVLSDATAGGPPGLFFAGQRTFAVGSDPLSASVAAADFNGDGRPDLVTANFDANTASVLLNTTAPVAVTTPVLVADVHGQGVVEYNRTTGAWVQLNPGSPSDVSLLAADPQGDVFADYRGFGVYRYTPSLGSWQLVAGVDAIALAVDARGDVFLSFTGAGVGEFRLDGSSRLLTPVAATLLAANANGDLAGEFVGYGVSRYNAFSGSWTKVNGVDAEAVAIDGAGDVFASFNGAGVGEFRPDGSARLLTPVAATLLAVNGNGVLAGQFAGYGVSRYSPSTGAWVKVNGTDAQAVAVDALGDVFASFNGAGVGEFTLAGGGQLVDASAAPLLAADPFGDPFAPL